MATLAPEAIRAELTKILASPQLARSERLCALLSYVVEQSLAGRAGEIKESVIGVGVFRKPAEWDPKADSIVRTHAARLRDKLHEYYASDGRHDPVVIEIPTGTYAPKCRAATLETRWLWRYAAITAACLVVAASSVLLWKKLSEPAIRSVAVLPLQNLDGRADHQPTADGLTEDLIRYLSALPNLRVISATSSFALRGTNKTLREIGALLDVDAVVEGSVQWDGSRAKVVAKLIRVSDDRVVWSGAFERELRDLFGLQEEVAAAVARTLRPSLEKAVSAATAMDPEAYQLYLLGLAAWRRSTEASEMEAIGYFEKAAEKDPRSARPWPAMASAYIRMLAVNPKKMTEREAGEKSREAALRALEIDAQSAEAHAVLAVAKWNIDRDWKAAQAEFTRAIELNPNSSFAWDAYSVNLRITNRLPEALDAAQRAERLDPLSPEPAVHVALVYFMQRNYDQALAQCRRVLERHPQYPPASLHIARVYLAKGMCPEALQTFRRLGHSFEQWQAYAMARCGQKEEARQWLGRLEHESGGGRDNDKAALVYVALGDKERALDCLVRSHRTGAWNMGLATAPEWDPLRAEPRFQALLKQMRFAE